MNQDDVKQVSLAYPDLSLRSVRFLANSGQFSNVYIINESLVFRFPRSIPVAQRMAREISILRAIQPRVTLPIPDPVYVRTDPQTGLVLFMGYSLLAGESATSAILADQLEPIIQGFARELANFLKEIHGIPPGSLGIALPTEGTRDDWLKLYDDFRANLYQYMRPDAQAEVDATFANALDNSDIWQFAPVVRHGDFGTRNILYDPRLMAVTGIIDFSEAGIGDPAQDVGAVWSLGDRLMPYFFDCYPEMRETLPRVKFIRSTYALQQALYALRDGNWDDFDDGIRNYR